jgi:ribosomal protein S18 acetylase RimI-like enzyme
MHMLSIAAELVPELTRLINRQIAAIPPGWQLSEPQVAAAIGATQWDRLYPADAQLDRTFTARCLVDGDRVLAGIQWQEIREGSATDPPQISVSWLAADPDRPAAVRPLLETLLAAARRAGYESLALSGRYEFGLGWSGIPAGWTHITAVLEDLGFVPSERWVIMVADTQGWQQAPHVAIDQLTLRWESDAQIPEWRLEAQMNGHSAGECHIWGPPLWSAAADFDAWAIVEWIEVDRAYRQYGLGQLLLFEQARFQAASGRTRLMLYTEVDNLPARRLFERMGFIYGPECWCWNRSRIDVERDATGS